MQKISNISLTTPGATLIFTPVFSGVSYITNDVIVNCKSATNVGQVASISVGTNEPNFDNILPLTPLVQLLQPNNYIRLPVQTIATPIRQNVSVFVNVRAQAVAGSQIADIYIDGFYA